jgi:hypothetical protein
MKCQNAISYYRDRDVVIYMK